MAQVQTYNDEYEQLLGILPILDDEVNKFTEFEMETSRRKFKFRLHFYEEMTPSLSGATLTKSRKYPINIYDYCKVHGIRKWYYDIDNKRNQRDKYQLKR